MRTCQSKIYIKQRINLNHNIIYTTTCDVPILEYLINHRSKSLSDAIIIIIDEISVNSQH